MATLKQPPSSSSRNPTDVFFSGLSPNSVLVTTVIIIVVVVAVVSVAEKGLSSVESELRRKPSDAPPRRFSPSDDPDRVDKNSRGGYTSQTRKSLWTCPRDYAAEGK